MIPSDFALMIYFLLKEQSHYVQEYKRMQELAALMEHSVSFHAGKQYDKLCAGAVDVPRKRFGA